MRNGVRVPGRLVGALVFFSLLSFTVYAQETLAGKVLLPDGQPAPGAVVKLYYCHDLSGYGSRWLAETKADEKGEFKIEKPAFTAPAIGLTSPIVAQCYLVALLPGYAAGVAELGAGEEKTYTITLANGVNMICKVLDVADQLVKGATVSASALPEGTPYVDEGSLPGLQGTVALALELYRGATDANGILELTDVPPSTSSILALHPERGWGNAVPSASKREAKVSLMWRSLRIRGRVLAGGTGKPVADMTVAFANWRGWRSPGCIPFGTTDQEGEYSFTVCATPSLREQLQAGKWKATLVALDPAPVPAYAAVPVPLPAIDKDAREVEVNFQLERGKVIRGKLTDAQTGQPVKGATLALRFPDPIRFGTLYRLSDANGEYQFRVAADAASYWVSGPPPGCVVPGQGTEKNLELQNDVTIADLQIELAKEVPQEIAFVNPDGTPAASGASVWAVQLGVSGTYQMAAVDSHGHVRLRGLAEGREFCVHAFSRDRSLGVLTAGLLARKKGEPAFELKLRPTRTLEVVLRDQQGNDLAGGVNATAVAGRRDSFLVARGYSPADAREKLVRVPGMLPDVEYRLAAQSAKGRLYAEMRPWRFKEDELNPRLTLTLEPWPEKLTTTPAFPPRTEENFKRDLASLTNALWKKEDAVQKELTWYAEKRGLAVGDSERKEVKRFKDLLDAQNIVVSGIAFAQDKVWVGTDKGVFAWDRKDQYWARFAVGGTILDSPIREISLGDDGKLHVTVEEAAKPPRRFEYDAQNMKWLEKP